MNRHQYFALRCVFNKRWWRHKNEHWHPFAKTVNEAKWFNSFEEAEEFRKKRQDPERWEVVSISVTVDEQVQQYTDRIEELEATILRLFPEAGAVGAKSLASEVLNYG